MSVLSVFPEFINGFIPLGTCQVKNEREREYLSFINIPTGTRSDLPVGFEYWSSRELLLFFISWGQFIMRSFENKTSLNNLKTDFHFLDTVNKQVGRAWYVCSDSACLLSPIERGYCRIFLSPFWSGYFGLEYSEHNSVQTSGGDRRFFDVAIVSRKGLLRGIFLCWKS